MNNLRRRRRDAGLATVARWTRRAVAGGAVLAGVLGASLAHLLPGQAAPVRQDAPSTPPPPPSAASPRPAAPIPSSAAPIPSSASASPHRRHHHHHASPRLVPPSSPPQRSPSPPHVTSGGS